VDDATLRDPARVIATLSGNSRADHKLWVEAIRQRIDEIETSVDKTGIKYARYALGESWWRKQPMIVNAMLPLAESGEPDLRTAALGVLGKIVTLNRRNGAMVLSTAGTDIRRYARENPDGPLQEDVGVAAEVHGRAKRHGGRTPFERSLLIQSSALPEPAAAAMFWVEDRIPQTAIDLLIRALRDRDSSVRSAVAGSLALVLVHYADAAAPGLEVLRTTEADDPSPEVRSSCSAAIEEIVKARSELERMGAEISDPLKVL